MAISREEVRRIAALAALRLSDDEADRLAGELADILDHFDALRELGTGQHRDTGAHGDTGTPLRPDAGAPDPLDYPPGEAAPAFEDGFFTVPRLASHGEAAESLDTPSEAGGPEAAS